MNRLLSIMLAMVLLVGCFCFGVICGHEKFASQIIYKSVHTIKYPAPEVKEIIKPVYVEKPVYITVEKPVYLDRPVYKAVMIQNTQFDVTLERFRSVGELRTWLDKYEEPNLAEGADCDDKAIAMFLQAMRTGKYMSTEVIESQGHMVCSTIIDNEIYFIDNNKAIYQELAGFYWRVD